MVANGLKSLRRYLINQGADEFGLKNVAQRNPVQEAQEGLQCGVDQWSILGIFLGENRREQGHKSPFSY